MTTKENYFKDLMAHVLQVMYMLFLGIIIAVFFGLGIDTFYPAPKYPEYPVTLESQFKEAMPEEPTSEQSQALAKYEEEQRNYESQVKVYNRNASVVAIALAVIALALSLTILLRWEVIANGMLLGGIFTLAYSLILGVQAEDAKFRFLLVTVGVLVTFALGYIKFVLPNKEVIESTEK